MKDTTRFTSGNVPQGPLYLVTAGDKWEQRNVLYTSSPQNAVAAGNKELGRSFLPEEIVIITVFLVKGNGDFRPFARVQKTTVSPLRGC